MDETLKNEIDWCRQIIDLRFEQYFCAENDERKTIDIHLCTPPELDAHTPYGETISRLQLGFNERLILTLALLPHLCPQALDSFFLNNKVLGRPYTEFGGWHGKSHSGFLPTCETASFLLAGDNLTLRLQIMRLFESDQKLVSSRLLQLEYGEPGEPKN